MIAKSKMYFFKYKEKIIMKITFTRQIVVEAMASGYFNEYGKLKGIYFF